jgi:hypothetical protein
VSPLGIWYGNSYYAVDGVNKPKSSNNNAQIFGAVFKFLLSIFSSAIGGGGGGGGDISITTVNLTTVY